MSRLHRALGPCEVEQINDLKWTWRKACEKTELSQMIYTASGVTIAIPVIEHVDLGPPITLRVRMREGQTVSDFVIAAPILAARLSVAELRVAPLLAHWVRIILVIR